MGLWCPVPVSAFDFRRCPGNRSPMRTLAEDTSPEAEAVLIGLWRKATPARKISLMVDTTRTLQEFMFAGLRNRHPLDSPAQLRRRFADLWLGPELARKAYGDFPDASQ